MRNRYRKRVLILIIALMIVACISGVCLAASGDVAGAIEATWAAAREQVVEVVNNVVFPVIDTILVVMFFGKSGTCYFEFKKHGSFDITGPAILFGCLIFTLTAPLYIWTIV